jgi:hypothetical protein
MEVVVAPEAAFAAMVQAAPVANMAEAAAAKAKEVAVKLLRRSTRSAARADEHTLLKAERLTTKKNLEFAGTSFSSFSDKQVISNLGRIGINLGPSGVAVIKNLEVDRLVLRANQKGYFKI